jgi:hypothetical protein
MQLLLLVIVVTLFFKVFPLEMQKRIINEAISIILLLRPWRDEPPCKA